MLKLSPISMLVLSVCCYSSSAISDQSSVVVIAPPPVLGDVSFFNEAPLLDSWEADLLSMAGEDDKLNPIDLGIIPIKDLDERIVLVFSDSSFSDSEGSVDVIKDISYNSIVGYVYTGSDSELKSLSDEDFSEKISKHVYKAYDWTYNNNPDMVNISFIDGIREMPYMAYFDYNKSLLSLSGLKNLEKVAMSACFNNNQSLVDISGLSKLSIVGENLYLNDNGSLADLDGLQSLKEVGGYIFINNNPSLVDVRGLSGITSLGGKIVIDKGISERRGLKRLDSSSWLCQPDSADYFREGYAQQDEVCLREISIDEFDSFDL